MSSQDLKRVESTLKYKGFAPTIVNDFIILVLNGELKHLFTYYNVMTVPILNTLPFVKMFDKMADGLLRHEVEGFIITIPSKGECNFENDNIHLPILKGMEILLFEAFSAVITNFIFKLMLFLVCSVSARIISKMFIRTQKDYLHKMLVIEGFKSHLVLLGESLLIFPPFSRYHSKMERL